MASPPGLLREARRAGLTPRPLCCRAECQQQVNRFPSASFKKFATEKEAWAFVGAGPPDGQQSAPAGSESSVRGGGREAGKEGGRQGRRPAGPRALCCFPSAAGAGMPTPPGVCLRKKEA